jgi:hypothetical protein
MSFIAKPALPIIVAVLLVGVRNTSAPFPSGRMPVWSCRRNRPAGLCT